MKRTAALRATDYGQFPLANDETRRKQSAGMRRRWHRKSDQNLLPFRVPCPTPITAKVYLPMRGSTALALLGRVYR